MWRPGHRRLSCKMVLPNMRLELVFMEVDFPDFKYRTVLEPY